MKAKSGPKKRKRKQNLALRMDVMNKNFFRAFKRECKIIFMSYIGRKRVKNFQENLNMYCEHLLSSDHFPKEYENQMNREAFVSYLALLLNYCQMKKTVTDAQEKERLDRIFEVIYSYSHKRFNELVQTPEIKCLIKVVMGIVGVRNFVNKNRFAKNSEKYEDHISNLLSTL